ncbi:MAG TPA: hypothetical protein GX731_04920 [Clostridiales bacterium]|nr:hypothetical protein [Clostridiales bacterium]
MNTRVIEIENSKIGAVISYYREFYQISQFKLCKGLCSIATLSRLESGERDVDSLLLETLLERLGKNSNHFELILTDFDYKTYQMREEIRNLIDQKKLDKASVLLKVYESKLNLKSNVHRQFVVGNRGLLNELLDGKAEDTIDMLMEAISYTIPGFKTNKINEYYFSNRELSIITKLIEQLIIIGSTSSAADILTLVLEYLDTYSSMERNNQLYPKVVIMKCKLLIEEHKYREIIELCDKGLVKKMGSKKLDFLGDLYYLKAKAIELSQKKRNGMVKSRECLDNYLKALYVYEFCDDKIPAEEIRVHIQEEYKWECID